MTVTRNPGFARIGAQRELKRAVESYVIDPVSC